MGLILAPLFDGKCFTSDRPIRCVCVHCACGIHCLAVTVVVIKSDKLIVCIAGLLFDWVAADGIDSSNHMASPYAYGIDSKKMLAPSAWLPANTFHRPNVDL